ncbi:phosphoglucomutase [Tepiditoga spiralis]|uniref:Phosphoglucomutase n=1 Tax=Tepiditoga spiralis TaxID=2108365 RepID=A0A7G1G2A0_9BACT|nr:phospho-sugar mutase [Tepiditoga spiralis]BBE29985.1 phosphoglucomutase [Tepiditoga spiralis]
MDDVKIKSYKTFDLWLNNVDDSLKNELLTIKSNENELIDRFYKDLEFGTGGMRGKIGIGSNRMNFYTVARASQGFANYLKKIKDFPSIVIAYDTRNKSDYFAKNAAQVFAANGINVYLFSEPTATPILSYAVRYLKADGGIVITASHNPAEYNGYKVYTSNGVQAVPNIAEKIIEEVNKLDYFKDINIIKYEEGINNEKIIELDNEVYNNYIDEVEGYVRTLVPEINNNLKIVYTPLHGTGFKPVSEILKKLDFNIEIVEEQAKRDINFSTVKSPNPEEKEAFKLGLSLAKKSNADIVLATDPDSDRIGVFEKYNNDYISFNGNEMGIMLSHFILSKLKLHNLLPQNGIIVKTIVSTDMIKPIAQHFNVSVDETLTGFKFIGEKIEEYKFNRKNKFIFGFEESYGYLANEHARDKDAVIASALISVMASELKKEEKTLKMYLNELYEKYGYYKEKLMTFTFEGYSGAQKIRNIMEKIKNEPPIKISSFRLLETIDYNKGHNNLPKSNVIELRYGSIKLIARPSGTEPKIKFYILVNSDSEEKALNLISDVELIIFNLIN